MLRRKLIGLVLAGLSTLAVSTVASAAAPGFYAGIQGGYGKLNYSESDLANFFLPISIHPTSSNKTSGIAGRAFAGYQFNENFAAELGFTQFSTARFNDIKGTGGGFTLNASGKIQQRAVDLVGKGILPLGNCFSAYGKLGVAYVMAKASTSGTITPIIGKFDQSDTERNFYPTFGAGVSYDITPNVPVSLGYDRIQKLGTSTLIKSSDFLSLGVAYNFG